MVTIRGAVEGRDHNLYSVKLYGLTQAVEAATTNAELDTITWTA